MADAANELSIQGGLDAHRVQVELGTNIKEPYDNGETSGQVSLEGIIASQNAKNTRTRACLLLVVDITKQQWPG